MSRNEWGDRGEKSPLPSASTSVQIDAFRRLLVPVEQPPPIVISSGEGAYVFDTAGRRYLDFGAGLGVNALGYSNPIVCEMISQQATRLIHCGSELINEPCVSLAEKLLSLTEFDNFFFSNSGAEANEAALKIARNFHHAAGDTTRMEILAFGGGFHGRTLFNISVAGNVAHTSGFGPLVPSIVHVDKDVNALADAISDKTAALMVETIQTRNGVEEISDELIASINDLRSRYGFLVIVDEVQTGSMRCGSMLDHRRRGLHADIVTLGKGLGGGLPIGVTLTSAAVGGRLRPGQHGSTFGGGPLVTAVALAVVETITQPEFVNEINAMAATLSAGLRKEFGAERVSGAGLLVGLRLPAELYGESFAVSQAALDHGLIVRTSGANAIRFTPPFIISAREIHIGIELLAKSIRAASVARCA